MRPRLAFAIGLVFAVLVILVFLLSVRATIITAISPTVQPHRSASRSGGRNCDPKRGSSNAAIRHRPRLVTSTASGRRQHATSTRS